MLKTKKTTSEQPRMLTEDSTIVDVDRIIQLETQRFKKRISRILNLSKFKNQVLIETIPIAIGCTAIHCEIRPAEPERF